MGCCVGIENIIGVVGFVVVVEVVQCDIECGIWFDIEKLCDLLEEIIESVVSEIIFVGKGVNCLFNISCFVVSGWKGEIQVMQMDLVGYVILVGLVCFLGKVKVSVVL